MFGVREHVSLSFGVSDKVLAHDPLFAEYFHGIEFVCPLLFDKVNLSEATAAKDFNGNEVAGSDFLILK